MLPSIPENLYQVLFIIGISVFGYSFVQQRTAKESYFQKATTYNSISFENKLLQNDLSDKRAELIDYSSNISLKYQAKNPIEHTDSTISITSVLRGEKNDVIVSDLVQGKWKDYLKSKKAFNVADLKGSNRQENIEDEMDKLQSDVDMYSYAMPAAALIMVIGLIGLISNQITKDQILRSQLKSPYAFCQSCYKGFGATVQRAKFNDGEVNFCYCNECFSNNDFTDPNLKPIDVIIENINSKSDTDWIDRKGIAFQVKRLRRWKWGRH